MISSNCKNAESFTKWTRTNQNNEEFTRKLTRAIAEMRRIKKYKNMSREELLIALLKSEQSHAEFYKNKSINAEIEETRKLFNEIRNKLLKSNTK